MQHQTYGIPPIITGKRSGTIVAKAEWLLPLEAAFLETMVDKFTITEYAGIMKLYEASRKLPLCQNPLAGR